MKISLINISSPKLLQQNLRIQTEIKTDRLQLKFPLLYGEDLISFGVEDFSKSLQLQFKYVFINHHVLKQTKYIVLLLKFV